MAVDQTLITDVQLLKAKGYSQSDIDTAYDYVPPPLPPAANPGFEFGFNLGGLAVTQSAINDPSATLGDIQNHYTKAKYIRAWLTSSTASAPPSSQWATTVAQAAAGYKVIAVYNLNNSPTRGAMPTPAQIATYFNALPPASQTGVWAFELVNECDYKTYYTGTVAQLAGLFNVAGPILHAKGYKVIGSNVLYGETWYNNAVLKAALGYVDYIGKHAYDSSAASALAEYDTLIACAAANKVGVCCTEVGLHNADVAVELPKLWAGLQQRSGIFIYFPFYSVAGNPAGNINRLFESPGVANANNAIIQPILGGA